MDSTTAERRYRAFLAAAQLRHPWQFRCPGQSDEHDGVQVDVPPGWYGVLESLFQEVEAVMPVAERDGFRWRRLCARHAMLEVAFDGLRDPVSPRVVEARERAAVTCDVCGHPGARREVAGRYAVNCHRHFIQRLLRCHPEGESGARIWWDTPQPALGGRSPAAYMEAEPPSEVLIEQALRLAMPPVPWLDASNRQRLQGAWPVLDEALGERLRSLRVAAFDPPSGRGGTLIAMMAGHADPSAQAAAVTRLARNGFSDLRLRLVGQADLASPAVAADPWACMLALEASVSVPRAQPDQSFLVR